MSNFGVDSEKLLFARVEMPFGLATFNAASPDFLHDDDRIADCSALTIMTAVETFINSQPHIDLPLPSGMLPGISPVEIHPFTDDETERLRKVVFNWPRVGGMFLMLRSISTPNFVARTQRAHPCDLPRKQPIAGTFFELIDDKDFRAA